MVKNYNTHWANYNILKTILKSSNNSDNNGDNFLLKIIFLRIEAKTKAPLWAITLTNNHHC